MMFYGADWCGDCRRSRALLHRLGVSYEFVDTELVDGAKARMRALNGGRQNIPTIVLADGRVLVEPSDIDLEAALV